jgi:hypothetical protein
VYKVGSILGNRVRKLLGWSVIILVVAGIAYLVWARAVKPLGQVDRYVLIKNDTRDTTICRVYLAEDPAEGWGANWIESPIETGAGWATIHLPRTSWPNTFRARAEDCQGAVVDERTLTLRSSDEAPEGLEPGEAYSDSESLRQELAQWIIEAP